MADSNVPGKRSSSAPVIVKPWHGRVRACYEELVLADTEDALVLEEDRHNPVYYFPVADVRMDWLEANTNSSHCPFKGRARYWNFCANGDSIENLAWAYPEPIPEVIAIKDHMAFYPDRVSIRVDH